MMECFILEKAGLRRTGARELMHTDPSLTVVAGVFVWQ